MDDRQSLIAEGTSWLLEMEALDSGQVKNALILNIRDVSSSIVECEILADSRARKMLIYLELNWWGRRFKQKQLERMVLERVSTVLPSFRFRVIFDRPLFMKALKTAEKLLESRNNLGPRI